MTGPDVPLAQVEAALRVLAGQLLLVAGVDDAAQIFLAAECAELEEDLASASATAGDDYTGAELDYVGALGILEVAAARLIGDIGTQALGRSLLALVGRVRAL